MVERIVPETPEQVLDAVKWAAAEETPLEVLGRGSKRDFGRPVEASHGLDLSRLSDILVHEPSELYVTCRPGAAVAEVRQALDAAGQHLSFEPPDLGPLLGREADAGSVGSLVACNLAGPRRIKDGGARDHLLGFEAVSGRGEVFKSGGTVVKNVTGFDLSKLMAGSFGTLAVMTKLTLKVLPKPEKTRTVLISWPAGGVYDHAAVKAMTRALGSSHEVSAAAHIPGALAGRSEVDYVKGEASGVTAVRVEGPGPSVEHRCKALCAMLGEFGRVEELHTANSAVFWKEVADVSFLARNGDTRPVWRLSVPPAAGSRLALKILEDVKGDAFYDWGGGLVWLAVEPGNDAGAAVVRRAVAAEGGHATLVRAETGLRARVEPFQPLEPVAAGLARRIKEGFDPNGVLNPGRMYGGV